MLRLQNVKAISVSWIKDGYSEVNVESRQRVLIQILLLLSFFQVSYLLYAILLALQTGLDSSDSSDGAVLMDFLSLSPRTSKFINLKVKKKTTFLSTCPSMKLKR